MLALLLALSVTMTEGEVTVIHAGAAHAAAAGEQVQEGDEIRTGAGGRVELAQETGTLVRIGERSDVVLHAAQERAFSAKLVLGNLWARVHKLLAGESFQVETENGVAGVRGTEFRVAAEGGEHLVRVYEGVVEVEGKGFRHSVSPGMELRFRRDRAPPPARFDAAAEKSSFAKWAREKGAHRAEKPSREERREQKQEPAREEKDEKEKEKEKREKRRNR